MQRSFQVLLCLALICTVQRVVLSDILPVLPDSYASYDSSTVDEDFELPEYEPSKGNLKNREIFKQLRFGLFIHWGVYSLLGRGEWVMHHDKIPIQSYKLLAPQFNPVLFNATEWVQTAISAGMRYITFTAKHHDGFCMWHTKQTNWNIVDATPFKTDVLRELAKATSAANMPLFVYYSPLDWSHPDYYPRGMTGRTSGRPESGNWSNYLAYMHRQLEEILTGYGPIAGIWLDGWWDQPSHEHWRTEETYQLIHRLQPDALIGNNHHRSPFWGEDLQLFEKDAPGENTAGYAHSSMTVDARLPLETCDTIHANGAWGYTHDHTPRPIDWIVRSLVRAAGYGGNLLLNLGPQPDGQLQTEYVTTLEHVGAWLATAGEAVYGTRAGPTPVEHWGASTHTRDAVYVHVLEWPGDETEMRVHIPALDPARVWDMAALSCLSPLCDLSPDDLRVLAGAEGGSVLVIDEAARDAYDTIVRLRLRHPASDEL
mmetsp:Transcript_78494/g.211084  ORF Transcript_78494/g.211084 Transcript_78494/m.211084 type:complete len:485 (-) Transcript_78494:76-1530(-)